MAKTLSALQRDIIKCRRCPRLVKYLAEIKTRYPTYWCKPVPLLGSADAKILLLGLAPGRFGSNRTGRMFTGDASGKFMFKILHELGLSSLAEAADAKDGLTLHRTAISAVVRCAPPQNKPLPGELNQCRPYFEQELDLLKSVEVVVALGKMAHDGFLRKKRTEQGIRPSAFPFAHGAVHRFSVRPHYLVDVYHPSRQNTQTGRLTASMFKRGIQTAIRLAASEVR